LRVRQRASRTTTIASSKMRFFYLQNKIVVILLQMSQIKEENMSIFALQGTFFLAYNEEIQHLAVAVRRVEFSHVFSGHFVLGSDREEYLGNGVLLDHYGPSNIHIDRFTETEFHFWKTYLHNGHSIKYEYQQQESGLWAGRWDSMLSGSGSTKCRLSELSVDDFAIS
jgi:hypothetical protein